MPFAFEHFGQCQPIVLPYLSCTADFLFATSPFGELFFVLRPKVPSGKKRSKTTKPCLLSIPHWQRQYRPAIKAMIGKKQQTIESMKEYIKKHQLPSTGTTKISFIDLYCI